MASLSAVRGRITELNQFRLLGTGDRRRNDLFFAKKDPMVARRDLEDFKSSGNADSSPWHEHSLERLKWVFGRGHFVDGADGDHGCKHVAVSNENRLVDGRVDLLGLNILDSLAFQGDVHARSKCVDIAPQQQVVDQAVLE